MENALIPFDEVQQMGLVIAKSGLFGIKTAEQAIALMLIAQAEGRHPATVAQEYDIIQGRPALKSQSGLIRFQDSGGHVKWIERNDKICKATFTHPKGSEITIEWTIERAEHMGYTTKDNWKKQPMIMLQWRCVAEGVRLCYPACLSGQYFDTEVQDFDPPRAKTVETQAIVIEPTKEEPKQVEAPKAEPVKEQPKQAAPKEQKVAQEMSIKIVSVEEKKSPKGKTYYVVNYEDAFGTYKASTWDKFVAEQAEQMIGKDGVIMSYTKSADGKYTNCEGFSPF